MRTPQSPNNPNPNKMGALIGIALIVNDVSKGEKLVFRYPPPEHTTGMSGSSSGNATNEQHEDFHKYSPSVFAKLFRATGALCGGSFELVIDNLRFLSFPTKVQSALDFGKKCSNETHNSSIALERDHENPNPNPNPNSLTSPNSTANLFVPTTKEEGTTERLDLSTDTAHELDSVMTPSHSFRTVDSTDNRPDRQDSSTPSTTSPTPTNTEEESQQEEEQQQEDEDGDDENTSRCPEVSFIAVVFILNAEHEYFHLESEFKPTAGVGTYGEQFAGSAREIELYQQCITKLTHALQYEELQTGYVSTQVRKVFAVHEALEKSARDGANKASQAHTHAIGGGGHHHQHHHHHHSTANTDNNNNNNNPSNNENDDEEEGLGSGQQQQQQQERMTVEAVLRESRLACELRAVFRGLSLCGYANVRLNSWMPVSLSVRDPLLHPHRAMRPFQTILLDDDDKDIQMAIAAARAVVGLTEEEEEEEEEEEHNGDDDQEEDGENDFVDIIGDGAVGVDEHNNVVEEDVNQQVSNPAIIGMDAVDIGGGIREESKSGSDVPSITVDNNNNTNENDDGDDYDDDDGDDSNSNSNSNDDDGDNDQDTDIEDTESDDIDTSNTMEGEDEDEDDDAESIFDDIHRPPKWDAMTSPQVTRMLRYVQEQGPFKSFQDISLATNITLEQVTAIAGHLVFWGKGQVIDTLHKHSMFRVCPTADLHDNGSLANAFRARFVEPLEKAEDDGVVFPTDKVKNITDAQREGNNNNSNNNNNNNDNNNSNINSESSHRLVAAMSSPQRQPQQQQQQQPVEINQATSNSSNHILAGVNTQRAKPLSLSTVLAFLCEPGTSAQPNTLAELMDSAQSRLGIDGEVFLQVMAWLLRKRAVVQVHMYVFLVVPSPEVEHIASRRSDPTPVVFSLNENSDEDREEYESVDGENGNSLNTARQFLLRSLYEDTDTYRLLLQLERFFDGRSYLEDIMWRESISREQLAELLRTYRDILVTYTRE